MHITIKGTVNQIEFFTLQFNLAESREEVETICAKLNDYWNTGEPLEIFTRAHSINSVVTKAFGLLSHELMSEHPDAPIHIRALPGQEG